MKSRNHSRDRLLVTAEPTTRVQFLEIAGKQHMGEFDELFGFKLPVDHVLVGEADGLQTMTSFEVARTEPVLSEIVLRIAVIN